MHIERLKITAFRNLKDFEIRLTKAVQTSGDLNSDPKEFKSHAVIGQNGSGKSNLLEAIITIFRDLDLNNATALDYEIDCTLRGV